jgi:effector-binding domain-containing protein
MMLTGPEVIERPAQPYVAIKAQVTMQTLGPVLVPLHARLLDWLRDRETSAAGPPFWKYDRVDMDGTLDVEVGVPIAVAIDVDDEVMSGLLPAGRYATLRHTGHPDELLDATGFLLGWAQQHDLAWDVDRRPDGEHWTARLEIYETDPAVEPDMTKWKTQLAFRLADHSPGPSRRPRD